jgi:hypothetical protein
MIFAAVGLCLVFLWGLKLFRTGSAPFRSLPILYLNRVPTSERSRSGGIQLMLLAAMGLVVLAMVSIGKAS